MTTLLSLLPLLTTVSLTAGLLVSVVTLFRRYQHPRRILMRAISSASILAVLGIIGIVPASLWWVPWLLTLALAVGVVVACRRLLVQAPPAEPTKREAKHIGAPALMNLATEVVLYLALLGIALVAS